ncbi:MAG: thiolase domain-containing protein [Planctomycetes bacterium]|nr:thiolase domain-containing protein [Planctomycetota bacterium]
MRDVVIIGVGTTKFGELWESSLRDLAVEAALKAIDDAGCDRIDSLWVGCMSCGLFNGQEHLGALVADYLGRTPMPACRVESACASGGMALRAAWMEVACGQSDVVMALGVEKMTDVSGGKATYALAAASDREHEAFHGVTFPGLYALIAVDHMHRYGTTREQLADVSVKNHEHGSHNQYAQYPHKVTREQVMSSTMVADPLRVLDCSPISDGASAVIVAALDESRSLTKNALVKIAAIGAATDSLSLHQRKDLCEFAATIEAGERAFKTAKLSPSDIDVAEVHDCFTISEICVTEALGFFERGRGGPAASDGATRLGGKIPVNTSGGLKSKGHPVGATGIAQVYMLTKQLRGEAGPVQVKNARRALAQNMGGTGSSNVVTILESGS